MASKMQIAELSFVPAGSPDSQPVAVLEAPGKIVLRYAKIPQPGPDEIRIKIHYVGICGSDVETYRGLRKPEFMTLPARLGHEVSGVIDAVGRSVHTLKRGMKVSCRYVWGAFAEYIVCRPFNVKVVPDDFPDEEISSLEVLPGILHAAELARIGPNTRVLITGQGVSGLVMTQVIALYSPRELVVTDLHDKNLQLAERYGATATYRIPTEHTPTMDVVGTDHPDGFDVVIPCLLEGDGMVDALDACAFGGRIVMYGCIGTCTAHFDFFKMHKKRVDIYSTEPKSDIAMRRFWQEGLQLVQDGLVNTVDMVTHRFPLARVAEAFHLRDDKAAAGAIHILIDCRRSDAAD
ncbi:putative zinc-type alcohol dehydrogenase-like protein YdjJ [Neolewinella maritima]|uniref:Zinc-type alcohol dehydrogenase-like protein YdjJ n=1 Tax=Neolewinella maritima TaxID=1383882 RepID=A0ABM9B2E1_9BACT|nr:alcohol dehydrogenase catalytic domain-containing protein [Neolewinella maritima]CAH1001259.1 putative zinc-type alcohol dehydrogenase-like protein YdjJ [Neolewinella maritima]